MIDADDEQGYYRVIESLKDILEKSAPSRIINVASSFAGGESHECISDAADYDVSDLEFTTRPYSEISSYKQSKAADRLLSWHYADQLKSKGVTVNALTPGLCDTQVPQDSVTVLIHLL